VLSVGMCVSGGGRFRRVQKVKRAGKSFRQDARKQGELLRPADKHSGATICLNGRVKGSAGRFKAAAAVVGRGPNWTSWITLGEQLPMQMQECGSVGG
jgi:hypothetical protein